MAAVRNFSSGVPSTFRLPEWEADIFYPRGSMVRVDLAVPDSDDVINYFANIYVCTQQQPKDWRVAPDVGISSIYWDLILSSVSQINYDSDILFLYSFDSDQDILHRDIDSDIHRLYANDSEMDSEIRRIDSELQRHARILDSDHLAVRRTEKSIMENQVRFYAPDDLPANIRYNTSNDTVVDGGSGFIWYEDQTNQIAYVTVNGNLIESGAPSFDAEINAWRVGLFARSATPIFTPTTNFFSSVTATTPTGTGFAYGVFGVYTVSYPSFYKEQSLQHALRATVDNVYEIDSDLYKVTLQVNNFSSDHDRDSDRLSIIDSELRRIIDSEIKERKAQDSDIHDLYAKDSDLDSDIRQIKHDFRAHDSDQTLVLDSEFTAVRITNHEDVVVPAVSGDVNMFTSSRTFDNRNEFQGWAVIDGTRILVWDSEEGGFIYYDSETTDVEIKVNGTKYLRTSLIDSELAFYEDSDFIGNFPIYEFRRVKEDGRPEWIVDSDLGLVDALLQNDRVIRYILNRFLNDDSDILALLDSETHDRKAVDSDIFAIILKPEETITLVSGTDTYTLTNSLLNEETRWTFKTEIEADGSIYNGVVNDHFEIEYNDSEWVISVDGVQGREYVDILVAGSATVSGQAIDLAWDDNSTVTIRPLSSETPAAIATQLYTALFNKNVIVSLDTAVPSVTYSADGRIAPDGVTTINGISFTFFQNPVTDEGYYYKDADTITIRKK